MATGDLLSVDHLCVEITGQKSADFQTTAEDIPVVTVKYL